MANSVKKTIVNVEVIENSGTRIKWPFAKLGRGKNQIHDLWVDGSLEKKIYTALSKWKVRHPGFNYKTSRLGEQILVKRVY